MIKVKGKFCFTIRLGLLISFVLQQKLISNSAQQLPSHVSFPSFCTVFRVTELWLDNDVTSHMSAQVYLKTLPTLETQ
jgi:hypothetical protein